MINYDDTRRDITIDTIPGLRTQSRLIIREPQISDSGNYTCNFLFSIMYSWVCQNKNADKAINMEECNMKNGVLQKRSINFELCYVLRINSAPRFCLLRILVAFWPNRFSWCSLRYSSPHRHSYSHPLKYCIIIGSASNTEPASIYVFVSKGM